MNFYRLLNVIVFATLLTIFSSKSFAEDDSKKDEAVKIVDSPVVPPSRVKGCLLKIRKKNITLYSDRSLHAVPIAKVPAGNYEPLDYLPGWYKIKARGWIAWIPDPDPNTDVNNLVEKTNCPAKKGVVKKMIR